MKWERAGKKIDIPLIEYLDNLIKEELSLNHKLMVSIGTDSQRNGLSYKFATVILITVKEDLGDGELIGRGGKIISSTYHLKVNGKIKDSINERMLTEVTKSIEVAYEIAPLLDSYGIKMEIHADINPDPKWESNKALTQSVGYILGMGYEFKVKPESWAASYVGDRYCH
jgi:predicted RNase H-related nuclease YkuK (DUF458 family)